MSHNVKYVVILYVRASLSTDCNHFIIMNKKIFAIGLLALAAVPMLASAERDREDRSTSTRATSTQAVPTQAKITCVQNAIEKRENILIAGHGTFNTSIVQALTARKDSLKSAYALTDRDAAKTAKKATWNTFGTQTKVAHDTMRSTRKASWNTFNTDMRACGVAHDESPRAIMNPTSSL